MHWYSSQVAIFVHITYFQIAGICIKPSTIYDIYLMQMTSTRQFTSSINDKQHDTHFVQHCFQKHVERLKQFGLTIRLHWV